MDALESISTSRLFLDYVSLIESCSHYNKPIESLIHYLFHIFLITRAGFPATIVFDSTHPEE